MMNLGKFNRINYNGFQFTIFWDRFIDNTFVIEREK